MDSVKIVVFDLGGVLVRVARTWREAAAHAGVPAVDPMEGGTPLSQLPGFEAYQAEQIGWKEFLQRLRLYLNLANAQDAERVHQHILMDPFPGTEELIQDLHDRGYRTACLSNTNAAHWTYLRDPAHYPAIAALQLPVASHEVAVGKPEPQIYATLETLAECGGSEIIFFDDVLANIEAARQRGWLAFHIDPSADPVRQMREALLLALAA